MRGNSHYKEGTWRVQIPSITFMQKNENEWPEVNGENKPPLVLNYIPSDVD